MTKIVCVAGSLRAGSFNAALLRAAAGLMPSGSSLEIATIKGMAVKASGRHSAGIRQSPGSGHWRIARWFRYDSGPERVAACATDIGYAALVRRAPARVPSRECVRRRGRNGG